MKLLGTTMHGHSQYDDRLWALLCRFEDVDLTRPDELGRHPVLDGVDQIGLLPFMVLAGASARSERAPEGGDLVVISIEVPEDDEERFYAQLEQDLTEARAFYE